MGYIFIGLIVLGLLAVISGSSLQAQIRNNSRRMVELAEEAKDDRQAMVNALRMLVRLREAPGRPATVDPPPPAAARPVPPKRPGPDPFDAAIAAEVPAPQKGLH